MIKKLNLISLLVILCCLGVPAQQGNGESETSKSEKDAPKCKDEIVIPDDYESDGCTMFPDMDFRDCCVAHDRDYFKGGSSKERRKSDDRLYRCIKNKGRWYHKILAPMVWVGVRVGGVGFLPTPFRWGFGRNKVKKKMQVFQKPQGTEAADGKQKKEDQKLEKPAEASPSPSPSPTPTPTPDPSASPSPDQSVVNPEKDKPEMTVPAQADPSPVPTPNPSPSPSESNE